MGIGNADGLALVLENQNMIDSFAVSEIDILLLPNAQEIFYFANLQLGERQVVARTVTDDPRDAGRRSTAIETIIRRNRGSVRADTGMIVVENKRFRIVRVSLVANPQVAGT
jgi:hypothetical protein